MSLTPQQEGRLWEKVLAKVLGAKPQPGSGNGPLKKLDIEGTEFLASCKWTEKASLSLSDTTLREAESATHGISGTGAIPIHFSRVEGSDGERIYATLDIDDLLTLFQEEIKLVTEDKASAKYRQAEIPDLFRD